MNNKSYKFYKGIFELAVKDYYNDLNAVRVFFAGALDFDFDVAAEMWDYLVTDAAASGVSGEAASRALGDNVLEVFIKRSAVKAYKLVTYSESALNVLYTMPDAPGAVARGLLINFLMGAKLEDADYPLRAMQKGRAYGAAMKELIEALFNEIMKKKGSKKVTMPKKTAEFLLTHIAKIRSTERALLEQRIKEIL